MADQIALLLEAERRGILPAAKAPLLAEARKRGLIGTARPPKTAPAEAIAPEESTGDFAMRTAARTGKNVGLGVFGLADLVPSPQNIARWGAGAVNMYNQFTGSESPELKTPFKGATEELEGLLDHEMLQPRTSGERITDEIVRAGAGALTTAGAAGLASRAGSANRFITALGQKPVQQAVAAGTGAGAAGVAREKGASPLVQAGTGLLAGVGGAGAAGSLARTGSAGKALLQPFFQGGREVVAGRVLNQAATKPATSQVALAQSQGGRLPASTTGEVSADPGLAAFETRMRAIEPGRFAEAASKKNEARNALLDTIAGGGESKAITKLVENRDKVTAPMRELAFRQASTKRVDGQRVLDDIDELLASPDNAGKSVQDALKSIRTQIAGKAKTTVVDGIEVTEAAPLSDIRSLYAIRKEINRVLEGRYVNADESVLRYAGGQLKDVRRSIDDAISAVAPSWRSYLTKYSQLSKPINRAETVADIRQKTSMAAPDLATGRDTISQAKWRNTVSKAMPELSKTMTKGQIKKLETITKDLDRGAAVLAAGKTPGSDTAANLLAQKNMTVASVLGQLFASKGGVAELPTSIATLSRPLAWVTKIADDQVRELVVDAMLDPKLAAKLMQKGTADNLKGFSDALQQNLTRGTTQGALTGTQ